MNVFPLLPPQTNILFLGDNVGGLKDISFELQRAWCGILWKKSGLDGIRTARLERPALIICEMDLPDLSGLDVCRELRIDSVASNIPVVLVGDSDSAEARSKALYAGADEYCSRPRDSKRFLEKVFFLLESGRSRRDSTNYYDRLVSHRTALRRIMTQTAELLKEIDRGDVHVGLGRPRGSEPVVYDRIDLAMELLGAAADLFEEEARELDHISSPNIEFSAVR